MKNFISLSILLSVLLATPLFGQESEKEKRTADLSPALESITLAKQLALQGYESENPLYLINAAQLLIDNPTQELIFEESKESGAKESTTKTELMVSFEASALLEDAKLFAKGNSTFLMLIDEMESKLSATSSRGSTGGPSAITRIVEGDDINMYEVNFIKGELAEVLVVGDGDTDLDLFVFDSLENLIEKDDDYTDRCYVSWVPKWTGKYVIVVKNLGPVYNKFTLAVN
jgi:hypothetical protein